MKRFAGTVAIIAASLACLSACGSGSSAGAASAPSAASLQAAGNAALAAGKAVNSDAYLAATGCGSEAAEMTLYAADPTMRKLIAQTFTGLTITSATVNGTNGTTGTSDGKTQTWVYAGGKWQEPQTECAANS